MYIHMYSYVWPISASDRFSHDRLHAVPEEAAGRVVER